MDSSVSAGLLRDAGYRVIGVHLKCWNVDGCAEQDAEDARRAAETLKIPFYVFDFEREYRERVVSYMVDGYKKGITPNPDVMCNQEIKFGLFYKRAMEMGADFVATGHYVVRKGDKLYTAKDKDKDQSYFLWTLTKKQIQHCLFPLGSLIKKTEVRRLAKKYKLPNAEKKDSQGVCFIGHITLKDFLADFITVKPGAIVNAQGKQIGEHAGAELYTIGQRHGLNIGGQSKPHYVSGKNIKKNIVSVAPEGHESLFKKEVALSDINLITPLRINQLSVYARVRYRQPLFKAVLKRAKSRYSLVFALPQRYVAPGQSAVWYSKSGEMLGGGVIR